MLEKIANPKNTRAVIEKYGFAFQKRFGQNFLIDLNILSRIVSGSNLTGEDVVVEIGPGIGSLTQVLAEAAKQVIAIEIDKKLIPILEDTLSEYKNIVLINEDVLKVDMAELVQKYNNGKPVKVIANLPYYITTPIIMGLFENHVPVHSITVMVQKEVAQRMQAKPGSKDYGALTLAVQYYSDPEILTHVSPGCFMPPPKVGSSVIQLVHRQERRLEDEKEQLLFRLIRAAFNQRRKTLMNGLCNEPSLNLTKEGLEQVLSDMGLDLRIRGEVLSLEQFIELTEKIHESFQR